MPSKRFSKHISKITRYGKMMTDKDIRRMEYRLRKQKEREKD